MCSVFQIQIFNSSTSQVQGRRSDSFCTGQVNIYPRVYQYIDNIYVCICTYIHRVIIYYTSIQGYFLYIYTFTGRSSKQNKMASNTKFDAVLFQRFENSTVSVYFDKEATLLLLSFAMELNIDEHFD